MFLGNRLYYYGELLTPQFSESNQFLRSKSTVIWFSEFADIDFNGQFDDAPLKNDEVYAMTYQVYQGQTVEVGFIGLSRLFPVVNCIILVFLLAHMKTAAKKIRCFLNQKIKRSKNVSS